MQATPPSSVSTGATTDWNGIRPFDRRPAHRLELPSAVVFEMMCYLDGQSIGRFMSISWRIFTLGHQENGIWKRLCERVIGCRPDPFQGLIESDHLGPVGEGIQWNKLYGMRYQGREPWTSTVIRETYDILTVVEVSSDGKSLIMSDSESLGSYSLTGDKLWGIDAEDYQEKTKLITSVPNQNIVKGDFPTVTTVGGVTSLQGRYGAPFEIRQNGDIVFQGNRQRTTALGVPDFTFRPLAVLLDGSLVVPSSDNAAWFSIYSPNVNERPIAHQEVCPAAIAAIVALPNGEFVTYDCNGFVRRWSRDLAPLRE